MIVRRLSSWPGLEWRNPFGELERIRREMDQLARGLSRGAASAGTAGVFPLTNLSEDADNFYLRAELPGMKSEDLDISVTGESITLSGERRIPEEEGNATYHRRERDAGRFSRIVNLPDKIDSGKIEAEMKNGILSVILPKAEESKPRQISVKSA